VAPGGPVKRFNSSPFYGFVLCFPFPAAGHRAVSVILALNGADQGRQAEDAVAAAAAPPAGMRSGPLPIQKNIRRRIFRPADLKLEPWRNGTIGNYLLTKGKNNS